LIFFDIESILSAHNILGGDDYARNYNCIYGF